MAAAFRSLRAAGYFARMDWQCCQSCGWAAVPDGCETAVFYHRQDAKAFAASGNIAGQSALFLAWAGNAAVICGALVATGLHVLVPPDASTRIKVLSADATLRDAVLAVRG